MGSEYFDHITQAGDRWDLIAYQYYGDAKLLKPLLLANPDIIGDPSTPAPLLFDKGVSVRIPILDRDQVDQLQLPPWKRGAV